MEKEQLDGTGWFTTDPAEASRFSSGQWQTADYQAGDVIIFTMKTIHMSTTNTTDKVVIIDLLFCIMNIVKFINYRTLILTQLVLSNRQEFLVM